MHRYFHFLLEGGLEVLIRFHQFTGVRPISCRSPEGEVGQVSSCRAADSPRRGHSGVFSRAWTISAHAFGT